MWAKNKVERQSKSFVQHCKGNVIPQKKSECWREWKMRYDYTQYFELMLCGSVAGAKEIDIAATLEHLRDQRSGMVQTKVRQHVKLSA